MSSLDRGGPMTQPFDRFGFQPDLEERLLMSRLAGSLFGAPGDPITLARFELVRELGRGTMGTVYEALDRECNASVALKLLSRTDAQGVYRIKREFRSLVELVHPNLVCAHQLFQDCGRWFFSMELVRGVPFDAWVAPDGRCDERRARETLLQLAAAVDVVHRAGKLHCDLKPSNVLVTAEGRVVLLDFGLVSDQVAHCPHSDSPVISGTPAYMAPEQAAGRIPSTASDWYAIGTMLFQALTGSTPFVGHPLQVLEAKQHTPAPDPRRFCGGRFELLCALCEGLLARDPEQRWGAAQLFDMLKASSAGARASP